MDAFDAQEIITNLWLGSEEAAHSPLQQIQSRGITHILTVGYGLPQIHPTEAIKYHRVNALDLPLFDITKVIPDSIKFIDTALSTGNAILVHCAMGVSRSASVVIAYLMYSKNISFEEAFHLVREKRSVVSPNQGFTQQLKALKFSPKET